MPCNFYPRSPRGERRKSLWRFYCSSRISIHAPREGSDVDFFRLFRGVCISIHAPREGSDLMGQNDDSYWAPFLSTLPARGATFSVQGFKLFRPISIHAPREGSDSKCAEK